VTAALTATTAVAFTPCTFRNTLGTIVALLVGLVVGVVSILIVHFLLGF
jgi:hypothetical protein